MPIWVVPVLAIIGAILVAWLAFCGIAGIVMWLRDMWVYSWRTKLTRTRCDKYGGGMSEAEHGVVRWTSDWYDRQYVLRCKRHQGHDGNCRSTVEWIGDSDSYSRYGDDAKLP